jgi:hypothetical protein
MIHTQSEEKSEFGFIFVRVGKSDCGALLETLFYECAVEVAISQNPHVYWCPEGDLNPHGLAACGF